MNRKISLNELAEKVDIANVNLSNIKPAFPENYNKEPTKPYK